MVRMSCRLALLVGPAVALAACVPPHSGSVAPARVAAAEAAARQAIQAEAQLTADSLDRRAIGVTPFAVNTQDTTLAPLGYGLADLLMTDLARSAQLHVVERLRLDALLRELQLASTGETDSLTAPRVGRLLRASRLLTGALSQQPGGGLGVDTRIADVVTGQVRPAAVASATLQDILRAEKDLAFRVFDELRVTLTPRERAAIEQNTTRNIAALLAYSRGVRLEVQGRYDAAVSEYRNALRLDPSFGAASGRLGGVQAPAAPTRGAPLATAASVVTDQVNTLPVAATGGAQQPTGASETRVIPRRTVTLVITISIP